MFDERQQNVSAQLVGKARNSIVLVRTTLPLLTNLYSPGAIRMNSNLVTSSVELREHDKILVFDL